MRNRVPTEQAYEEMQSAYALFNKHFFDGDLPDTLVTFQRHRRAKGYFARERFKAKDGTVTDELAMNPIYFDRDDKETLSTLLHEMCHVWQYHLGEKKPAKWNYHNKEWAAKMKEVGLHPSATGQPGGKEVGYTVSHYIIEGGPFDVFATEMLADGFKITWEDDWNRSQGGGKNDGDGEGDGDDGEKKAAGRKVKYTCPECGQNVWGKPGAEVDCRPCGKPMDAQDED